MTRQETLARYDALRDLRFQLGTGSVVVRRCSGGHDDPAPDLRELIVESIDARLQELAIDLVGPARPGPTSPLGGVVMGYAAPPPPPPRDAT